MEITDVKTLVAEGRVSNWIFVQVFTDEGITGVGEATNWPGIMVVDAAIRELKRYVVGEDPFNIEKLWQKMYRGLYWIGIAGAVVSAISGIEIALWDIIGKKLKTPIYNLLGGQCRDKIRLYANLWFVDAPFTPEAYAKKAVEAVEEGYTALKFDPFLSDRIDRSINRTDALHAVKMVKAVREAVGDDVDIAIETHAAFDINSVIKIAKKLEKYELFFLEEPVPPENVDAMAKVAATVETPICTGERLYTRYGFRELLEKHAADIIMPDVVRTGGILESKKIAAMADTYYVPVALHNPNGPIATMASVHLATCVPNFLILEFISKDAPWRDEVITEPIPAKNGYIEPPTKPGIGVELNEEVIMKHPYKEERFLPSGLGVLK